MDKSVFIAMTGASQNMAATAIHANNLANISTTGFKQDLEQARAMPVFGGHFPSRVYAMTERPATDTRTGSLQETGRDLDVAINGQGWLVVQAPDGSEAYSRSGELNIDTSGMLRTGTGLPVLGNGGPIAIPPAESITIGIDGSITIRPLGSGAQELAQIDRIRLVNPENSNLVKGTDGLMRTRDGAIAVPDAQVRLESGFLEGSNVNAVEALTSIIGLSRQFELQVKLMHDAEENSAAVARLLQFS